MQARVNSPSLVGILLIWALCSLVVVGIFFCGFAALSPPVSVDDPAHFMRVEGVPTEIRTVIILSGVGERTTNEPAIEFRVQNIRIFYPSKDPNYEQVVKSINTDRSVKAWADKNPSISGARRLKQLWTEGVLVLDHETLRDKKLPGAIAFSALGIVLFIGSLVALFVYFLQRQLYREHLEAIRRKKRIEERSADEHTGLPGLPLEFRADNPGVSFEQELIDDEKPTT
jgi:hypothetical protein